MSLPVETRGDQGNVRHHADQSSNLRDFRERAEGSKPVGFKEAWDQPLRSGFLEERVHDVVEEIEIGRLDIDGRELPLLAVPDPPTQVHLFLVARAVHGDRVSHDHLAPSWRNVTNLLSE